jgi:Flp pilus assembly protein protease CpaA
MLFLVVVIIVDVHFCQISNDIIFVIFMSFYDNIPSDDFKIC